MIVLEQCSCKEQKEYDAQEPWLKENKQKLADLEAQANSAASQDDLLDEYNAKVDEYNHDGDVLNNVFYLIPLPLARKHHK